MRSLVLLYQICVPIDLVKVVPTAWSLIDGREASLRR